MSQPLSTHPALSTPPAPSSLSTSPSATSLPSASSPRRRAAPPAHPVRRAVVALAATALVALAVTACGDSSSTTSSSTAGTTGTAAGADTTTTAVATGHTAHDHATVAVTAVDFNFEDLPERIPAGTRLTLANGAASELHELVAIRLPDGEDRPIGVLLSLPETELGALVGGAVPATVLLAAPGGDQISAVGDGTLTEPGRYLILCSIPTGVDPATYLAAAAQSQGAPPQVPGGPPHFVKGMAADLIVE